MKRGITGDVATLRSHHDKLKWPADIKALFKEWSSPSLCADYEKYKLLEYLQWLTEDELNTEADIVDINKTVFERFPLLDHIHYYSTPTKVIQDYINIMIEKEIKNGSV
jgi:hypothetical protein